MAKIQVNTQAPDFTIKDFHNQSFHLSDYQGRKNIFLVLNRSFS